MRCQSSLFLSFYAITVAAVVHNLFVGNLNGPASVHSLAFDDETNSLTKLHTFDADASHAWITFSVGVVNKSMPRAGSYYRATKL